MLIKSSWLLGDRAYGRRYRCSLARARRRHVILGRDGLLNLAPPSRKAARALYRTEPCRSWGRLCWSEMPSAHRIAPVAAAHTIPKVGPRPADIAASARLGGQIAHHQSGIWL